MHTHSASIYTKYVTRTHIMKMHELIASITDLIDKASQPEMPGGTQVVVIPPSDPVNVASPLTHAGDDINRFRQIVALADQPNPHAEYSNEPNEQYASIEAVTTHAGGGLNGPKHPSDIRGDHVSLYPAHQHGVR